MALFDRGHSVFFNGAVLKGPPYTKCYVMVQSTLALHPSKKRSVHMYGTF